MPSIVSPFKARRCLLIKSLVTRRARSVCKNVQQILLLLLVQRRTFYHRSVSIATMAPSSSAEIIFATSLSTCHHYSTCSKSTSTRNSNIAKKIGQS